MKRYLHLTLFIFLSVLLLSCNSTMPKKLGVNNGRLTECPKSPNCISSQADKADKQHYMDAITYTGSTTEAKEKLLKVVNDYPRTTIITDDERYIHVEFDTFLHLFTDDVEFYFPEGEQVIHFRSASRVGEGDLGVNRRRMEKVKKRFGEGVR